MSLWKRVVAGGFLALAALAGGLALWAVMPERAEFDPAPLLEAAERYRVRILRDEFGVEYSLNGIYALLHRLGFSSLAPRPRHRNTDPAAQEQFKIDTPLLWISSDGKQKVYVYRSGFRTNSEPASKAR